jgi:ParB/RepB/Spo0J family partition protein
MPAVVAAEELIQLTTVSIEKDPFATRIDINAEGLAQELKTDGQINAIHVLAEVEGGPYTLVAGHRRVAAARLLGWTTIRAVVHTDLTHDEAWRLAWKENAERRSLTQADRWWTVARLLAEGRNQATVAALLGIDKAAISRDAGWTKLPDAVRDQVGDGGFTFSHATQLIPYAAELDAGRTAKLLSAFRAAPCDVPTFRKLAKKTIQGKRARWPRGLRVENDRLTVDLGKLDVSKLRPDQVDGARALVRRLAEALESLGAGK